MSKSTYRVQPICVKVFLSLLLVTGALSGAALAQEGTSQAAAARTRYLSEIGVLPAAREVVVEEFVNYHRHQIGRPKAGEAVALDLRWGNDQVSSDHEAVLQVGFSTALANDRQQLRPLNLALVIDKSGSMAAADKLSRVKAALLTFVSQLRERDVLSIVVFDSEAQILLAGPPAGRSTGRQASDQRNRARQFHQSSWRTDVGLSRSPEEFPAGLHESSHPPDGRNCQPGRDRPGQDCSGFFAVQ